jgi:ligand-binding SRPBCC domain-containing protein
VGHIIVETVIVAPREAVFDLARDVSAHTASAAFTRERAVPPGRTNGLLELGDTVTFEGVHFLLSLRFTARIVEFEPPRRFVDELVRSSFRKLRHVHEFDERDGGATIMRDTLDWISPLGILGRIADVLFVTRHMRSFVTRKQLALKELAERR